MFPKEITQFLKRFQGSIRKRPGRQTKFGRGGKPTEHPELHLRACRLTGSRCPGCTASHQGRTGTGEPRHTLLKKGIVYLHLQIVRPVSHKCLFSFGNVKNHGEMRGEGFLQPAGGLFLLSCALGQHTAVKKPPHPQNRSQQLHTKTTFCDRAMCYSTGITSPFLPSLPCLFFFFFFPWVPGAPEGLRSIQDSTFCKNNTILTTTGQPYL